MTEERISEWRSYVRRRKAIDAMDIAELEDHLRSQVTDLREAGLDDEEAFLIGVKRLGELDTLSREFAREHSERLWKRLVVTDAEEGGVDWSRELKLRRVMCCSRVFNNKLNNIYNVIMRSEAT